ncbi:MAG TPA: ATP-dependent DNA helicase RecG [Phycisphaerae bacterium]|nr:ATP-dependent DNA helicase RecG [Phycisphaerae bacterium]
MGQIELDTPIRYVKTVGPARAEQLDQLGIRTVEDLLMYFPRRFDLRRQAQPIKTLRGDEPAATVAGEVIEVQERPYGKRPFFQCTIDDGTAMVNARWFHGGYLRSRITPGVQIALSGKVSTFRDYPQLINPNVQLLYDATGADLLEDELLPVYPAAGRLSSGIIAQIVKQVLPLAGGLVPRWFDGEYLRSRELLDRPAAVAAMHRPEDTKHWAAARRRLAFDECLLMQLGIAIMRMRERVRPAYALPTSEAIDKRIRARFPFELTKAQDGAVRQIAADLGRERPMNRLLQGDVGSGKTVVALYAALLAVANRKQAAIMAPTEILALQHFRKVEQYLRDSRVRLGLLIGGQRPAQRRQVLDKLAAGEIDLVVGTHALISSDVQFSRLALVVVDEQHKFGVRQRSTIRGKGYAPHYLVMTATPIPRTLALTVFGDLDVSVIDSLPPGRGRTATRVTGEDKQPEVMQFVSERLAAGEQAYIVYPLVSPSAELELASAQEAYEELTAGALAGFRVGLVHGQLPQGRKDEVMAEFRSGRVQALVASVVVEVGVDVPSANVMVVMHADRFGLAQLHQLRGRIGRGAGDATCILVASRAGPAARRRLEVLAATTDGFKIAEEDLRIRGPGEFFGTRQHGLPELKVADLIEDFELLRMARRDAFEIVREDPFLAAPHHQQLRREMLRAYAGRLDLLAGA